MGYEDQSHAELGEMLKERGLEVPKTKGERIAALTEADASTPFMHRIKDRFPWATVPVIAVVMILFVGGSLTAILFGDNIIGLFTEEEFDGELIDFDSAQARAFAEGLVALGDSEWQGRMSGSASEHAAAQSNLNNFTEFGLAA